MTVEVVAQEETQADEVFVSWAPERGQGCWTKCGVHATEHIIPVIDLLEVGKELSSRHWQAEYGKHMRNGVYFRLWTVEFQVL